ncbi:SET_domain-containing protein [Hexamita inflata]|uniref:SET_domain-containing protein n=1 Tax=Hexamita inflata TaxID=28002 RepID=A0ABP1GG59_9EUKA
MERYITQPNLRLRQVDHGYLEIHGVDVNGIYEQYKKQCSIRAAIVRGDARAPFSPLLIAQSLYDSGKYKESLVTLQQCLGNPKIDQELTQKLQEQNIRRIQESSTLCYDLEEIHNQCSQNNFINFGDYICPKLTLTNNKTFGNHFIANDNIKIGELLVFEKLVILYKQVNYDVGCTQLLTTMQDSELDQFSTKYVGKDLQDKLQKNMFQIGWNGDVSIEGFYPQTSYFNHSCDNNAIRFFAGNMIAAVASKNICKGDQIFLSYYSPTEMDRQELLALNTRYDFKCKCGYCSNINNPVIKKFPQIVYKLQEVMPTPSQFVNDAQIGVTFLKEIKSLKQLNIGSQYYEMLGAITASSVAFNNKSEQIIDVVQDFFNEIGMPKDDYNFDNMHYLVEVNALLIFYSLLLAYHKTKQYYKFYKCLILAYNYWNMSTGGLIDFYRASTEELLKYHMYGRFISALRKK